MKLRRAGRLSIAVALVAVVVCGAIALVATPQAMAGKPCADNSDCKKGAVCLDGNCVKPIIDCSVVLCLPCPPGTRALGVFPDCCKCVPIK